MSGSIYVSSGHTVTSKTIKDESLYVLKGGHAVDTKVDSAGNVYVSSGGAISGTQVFSGGFVIVSAGGKSIGTRLDGAISTPAVGLQIYGTASGTNVGSGWEDQVFSGGLAVGTTITNGGTEYLFAGKSLDAVVSAGGAEGGSGTQISTTVSANGQQFLYSGGVSSDTRILSGGLEQMFKGGKSSNTTVFADGNQNVYAGATAKNTVLSGGTLNLSKGAKTTGDIKFAATGSELVISGTKMPTAEITGFAPGDEIQLANVKYAKSDSVTVTAGKVTINAGGKHYTLKIAGAEAGATNYVFGSGSLLTETAATAMTFLHPAPTAAAATPLPAAVTHTAPAAAHVTSSSATSLHVHELTKATDHAPLIVLSAHAIW